MAFGWAVRVGFAALLVAFAVPLSGATFTVDSTADAADVAAGDGVCDTGGATCTLRAAIEEANALAGADQIHFAIGSGAQTIVHSALPQLSEAVTIDGTTQPGYSGTPLIQLGWLDLSSNATIRALSLQSLILYGNANTVELCRIANSPGDGVAVYGSNNVIRQNVITGHTIHGVAIYENETPIFPEFTALTPDLTLTVPTVDFDDGCGSLRHAGGPILIDTSGRPFNEQFGIRLTATMTISQSDNYAFTFPGLDDEVRLLIDGIEQSSAFLGSGDHSIQIDYWEGRGAARLLLAVSGAATPTFGAGFFAELFQARIPAEGNEITENAIYDNAQQGIALSCCCRDVNDANDLDVGPNTFLNYPVFTNRTVNGDGTIFVEGTATPNSRVEIFGSTNDPLGGEGKLFVASTIADLSGNFSTTITLPQPYYSITATATDTNDNTSEFSESFNVRPNEVVVTNTNMSGPGSLEAALFIANGDGVSTLITFDPSLSGASIVINSLPALTENFTTIDADINHDCHPDVEIRGNPGAFYAFHLLSNGNVIRGFALNRFSMQMLVVAGNDNEIRCNHLGLDLSGNTAYATGTNGLLNTNNASNTLIANNRIAGVTAACHIQSGTNLDLLANIIGWPFSATPLGDGVLLDNVSNIRIGDGTAQNANTFTRNGGAGVRTVTSSGITIRNNSFSDNGALAIDHDATFLNAPVITRAVATQVDGFLDAPPATYDLELYVSNARDPSGYGEGATRILASPIQPGPFTFFTPALAPGTWVTAIVIDNAGNTSEFSLAKEVTAAPVAATELTASAAPNGITLRWRDPQGSETGFRIERFHFNWDAQTLVGPNVTSWTDGNVSPATTFSYRVIALSAAGDAPPSNVATATTLSSFALQLCRAPAPVLHDRASTPSAASGPTWAIAYASARSGRASDIYFQRLNPNGTPLGSPVQITNDDVASTHPALVWNGTHYGLLWLDHLRGADGRPVAQLAFALLDANGLKVRGDLRITSGNVAVPIPEDAEVPLVWDGAGWGIFVIESTNGVPGSPRFYRLDADGDTLVNGNLFGLPGAFESIVSAAWNGSDYGVVFDRPTSPFQQSVHFAHGTPNGAFSGTTPVGGGSHGSIVWDGSAWAVAWAREGSLGTSTIHLRRFDTNGVAINSEQRISDDGNTYDSAPRLVLKPGGGFLIFANSGREIGRLEADANGDRVGSMTLVSANDNFDSRNARTASDGTNTLVAWSESRVNLHEIAAAVVPNPGNVVDVTTDHDGTGAASDPSILAAQSGFVAVWSEHYPNNARIDARIHRDNGTIVDRPALNNGNPSGPVRALRTNGFESAIVWIDRITQGVHFDRFENFDGDPLLGGGVRIADADVGRPAAFDFDGAEWGVVWVQSGTLRFQRMGHNTPIGSATNLLIEPEGDVRMQWIGTGWAVVFEQFGRLWFLKLDPTGALVIPPMLVTSTGFDIYDFDLQWTGEHLALVWSEYRPPNGGPGIDIFFATLDGNGFKNFSPVTIASTPYPDRDAAMAFDGTSFHIVHPDFVGGLREITVTPQGQITGTRFLGNHGEGRVAIAHNGATLAMAWEHRGEIHIQTTQCLTDGTPPACVALNATLANLVTQLSWPAANDPQSGILGHHLYRDGALLTELLPSTTSYTDAGMTPGTSYTYELRPYNRAYLEATGCTPVHLTAGILIAPATLPNARQNTAYDVTLTASQGVAPYAFAITNGAPPPGITLASNGVLSGTPSNVGSWQFTVTATDAEDVSGSRTYFLRSCPASSLLPTLLPDPLAGTPYQQTFTVQGASGPFTFSIASGALPAGLTLNTNGTLSGTTSSAGPFTFTVTATDANTCATSQQYAFTVASGREIRDLRADTQSSSSILVRWTRPQRGETGFRVERSFDGGVNWGSINIVGSDVSSHLDQGLPPSNVVHYRVITLYASDTTTSNIVAAITFAGVPTQVCAQTIGPYHPRAQYVSVAHDGTRWAAAWTDRRDNRLDDIYFQFLDDDTGAPTGSALPVTQTDMATRFPTLRWNGTHFGLLYHEHLRGPAAELTSTTNFALIDANGNVVRKGVRVAAGGFGLLNSNAEMPLVWDGAGWGVFMPSSATAAPSDIFYRRLAPNGDVLTGPVQLTNTPQTYDEDVVAAWNGSEYGLVWIARSGAAHTVTFARMQPNGTLIGSPQSVQGGLGDLRSAPSILWNAGEWAIAWNIEDFSGGHIHLRLFNADGTPKSAPTRISDDSTQANPANDYLPLLVPKSGGGYFAYASVFSSNPSAWRVGRFEADANGNRVGASVLLTNGSPGEMYLHGAHDGTRTLLAFEQNAPSQAEVASMLVDASGNVTSGPTLITGGHTAGGSGGPPQVVPLGLYFGAVWLEGSQLYAKFFNQHGQLATTAWPLVPSTQVSGRLSSVWSPQHFALAWRDAGTLRFGRFDRTGAVLADQPIGSGTQPALAWNGTDYAVAYFTGNTLRFQRIAANGSLLGPQVFVTSGASAYPLMQWVGNGWAIVWTAGPDLWFALLDRNGAFLVPPQQFTFTTWSENAPQIAWSGDRLGVTWREDRGTTPGNVEVAFTALKLDGTKAFNEIVVGSSPYAETAPNIYWDRDRFRIVYGNATSGTREAGVTNEGTILGDRLLHNRTTVMSVASNGATTGMLFSTIVNDLTFQTSACLDDPTAPPCPNSSVSFNGQRVRMTWSGVSDSSSILAYNVYRDGTHLAELAPSTLAFDDYGFVSGATHVYEVRAVNGAFRESTGCTTRSIVAGISLTPLTLPNTNLNANYNQALSVSGGTSPYTFAVTSGALPAGLTLHTTSGVISGNTTASGLFNFTVTATDSLAQTGSRAYAIRVCPGIGMYPNVLAEGYLGNAYSQTIIAAGTNVTLAVTTGALPAGLALDATGWIHGTPTNTGTFPFTITATDSLGCTAMLSLQIVVSTGSHARELSAFALSASSIRLRWTDPRRNETAFRVERSLNGTTWSALALVGPDVTTYTDASLNAATPYSYRIIATTPGGDAPSSNVATATTWASLIARTCIEQISPYHAFARPTAITRAGSRWAMAWQDRKDNGNDEIWFTFLDANGAMTGTPVRISNNDSVSLRPSIQWNGTNIGILWVETLRGPNGELHSPYRFALLDANGNVLRRDVRIDIPHGFSGQNSDPQFVWDGSAWAFVEPHVVAGNDTDLLFYRFDEDGDLISGPVNMTSHAEADFFHALAWNGTEFGMAWVRGGGVNQNWMFQRFTSAGAPIGSPVTINSSVIFGSIDVVARPNEWAVFWNETPDDVDGPVMLQRFNTAGAPLGAPVRLSNDPVPNDEIVDFLYEAIALPAGGYAVLTRPGSEISMLRADAAGNRVGTRVNITQADTFNSANPHVATDGTNLMLTYNDGRLGTQEIASVLIDSSGNVLAGPTDLTAGHSPGNASGFVTAGNQLIAPLGSGFVTLWNEVVPGDTKLYAKIFGANGTVTATKFPLSNTGIRGRGGVASVGSTFAVAYRTLSNALAFGRYDAAGNPVITETITPGGFGQNVNVGFDGENYAVTTIVNAQVVFQRITPNGATLGARATVGLTDFQSAPFQMIWTGSSWAILYRREGDVYYSRVDATGATIAGPVRVSFTPDDTKNFIAAAWSGEVLGVAWGATSSDGSSTRFTVLGLDGIKQFPDVDIAEGSIGTTLQGLAWANDRFRLVFNPAEFGTMREAELSTSGAMLSTRTLSNRGGNGAIAWNGATLGIAWVTMAEIFFQTSACLTDVTPPACPAVNATRTTSNVTLTWNAVTDAQSGIYRYYVWRDGALIGETSATSYIDAGVRAGDEHTYRVSAGDRAYRESPGCASITLIGLPAGLVASAPSTAQVQMTWQSVANATGYRIERSTNGTTFTQIGTSATTAYTDTGVAAQTSYLYRVRAETPQQVSAPSNVDVATTIVFTDDPLTSGVAVKSVHVTQLRTAVDALRALAQLAPATYTNSASAGMPIRASNVLELRNALNQALTALALPPRTFTNTITPGTPVRAIDLQEVRTAVK